MVNNIYIYELNVPTEITDVLYNAIYELQCCQIKASDVFSPKPLLTVVVLLDLK